jgi:hypothetical protein
MGDDPVSGKNFDHRKVWIEDYLREFAGVFGIDLLGFAILSNHFHLILRSRPDVVASWDDTEVARRWLTLCPHRRGEDGTPREPSEAELNTIRRCPVRLAEIRKRLSNLSWWMRLLCQRVAQRANREDEETGDFFQSRYKAVLLLDEAALVACAAYVDLNPIRAAMAETIEGSDHTSAQRRIEAMREEAESRQWAEGVTRETDTGFGEQSATPPPRISPAEARPPGRPCDSFLAPLSIHESRDPTGPCPNPAGSNRCSDKGFLAMSLSDYLQLLDWTARQVAPGKAGTTSENVPPVVTRLGLGATAWTELVRDFGKLFASVAGQPSCVDATRSVRTHRRFHVRRRVRELLTA